MAIIRRLESRTPRAAEHSNDPPYILRLFTTGSTLRSTRALRNLREICEMKLKGRYRLEVIDICQEPGRATECDIIAAPTLIKAAPPPSRRMIGDLSDRDRVLVGLSLEVELK
jgi:circadian clock protein KaiB